MEVFFGPPHSPSYPAGLSPASLSPAPLFASSAGLPPPSRQSPPRRSAPSAYPSPGLPPAPPCFRPTHPPCRLLCRLPIPSLLSRRHFLPIFPRAPAWVPAPASPPSHSPTRSPDPLALDPFTTVPDLPPSSSPCPAHCLARPSGDRLQRQSSLSSASVPVGPHRRSLHKKTRQPFRSPGLYDHPQSRQINI
jgi:hypothetical protein